RGNAHEAHVVGLSLEPALEVRFERIAVRTAVPEDLGDLDQVRARARRLRRCEALVVHAEPKALGRRRLLSLVEPAGLGAGLGSEGGLVAAGLEIAAGIGRPIARAARGEEEQPEGQQETV